MNSTVNIVTAQHLESWSNSLAARADLPGLVASLIRASCPSLQSYRFPSGDASQTHGFDGVAEVLEGNVFVPEGRSIWEFGAGKDYKSKAESDYKKRTDKSTPAERAGQTFTFVTSRKWDTGLDQWEQDRSADGWLKVRILDATSLELWLADYPAVALPLARKLGIIPPAGIRTVQDFWDEYRLNFAPTLKEELLLTGRADRAKRLCEALSAGLPNLSKWQADSPEEAAAFVAAAVMSAESETSRFLRAKTLIVDTMAAAQTVPTTSRFVFILSPSVSRVAPALARTSQVILTLGSDDRAGESETLDRMNVNDFAAGLRSMGIEEGEAFRLAGRCGRSLTVLSRLNASAIATPPKWHGDARLVPFVLAGGWNASNEHDRAILAKLSNTSYEYVDSEARRLASLSDAPVDLEGSIWTLRSHADAFTVLGCLIDSGFQRRLSEACIEVFSETDRRLEIPEDKRPAVPIRGDDFRHSEWLRRGLARTLVLISGLHEAARFKVIDLTAEQYVDGVVGSIPGLAEDIRVLASLKSELPHFAEAAPFPLAHALERVLEGESKNWTSVIFRDRKDASFWGSSSPHTHVLWALETMAWNPEYLYRAASSLMTLAEFDPGGSLANRPLSSLREIFLAWRPNTYASLHDRIAIFRSICRKRPKIGLQLAMSLLPAGHDISSGTARPHLRDFGEAKSKATTVADAQHAFQQYADIAVELAGSDISLLTELIDNLPRLDTESRTRAILAIRASAQNVSSEAVFQIWSKLHALVRKHRNFQEAAWALKADQIKPFEELCQQIEPLDPVRRIVWLFNDYAPDAGLPKGQDYIGDANQARNEALRVLLRENGLPAVLVLARTAKLPHFVGIALAETSPNLETLQEGISLACEANSGVSVDFAMALSAAAHNLHGPAWDSWFGRFAAKMEPGTAANLFLRWPDSRETWDFVASLSPHIDNEYWSRKWAFRPSSPEDLVFAFDKYTKIERFSAILDMVAYGENLLSTPQCIQVLRGLILELSKETGKLRRVQYEVVHMIQALQQREDVDLEDLAAIEYQYLPVLELQGEPTALNRLLATSPQLFISVIRDAFSPASGEIGEITDERRLRARLAYQLLQSIKTVPGFSSGIEDLSYLRSWISTVRTLAKEADRAIITDQQIGQILAYAPSDTEDAGWPSKPIRDLIEELAAEQVETGIAISRFNQRGSFTKALYDGGRQERALSHQYRNWAQVTRNWPRTSALLSRIAEDWDRHASRADSEAQLHQLRYC
ncbi:MAG: hypothetical protein JWO71_118 [Candidatus Acidoferrum typicum]|nr:hypothetical protein [Candidatus Acidoferrum typicum]